MDDGFEGNTVSNFLCYVETQFTELLVSQYDRCEMYRDTRSSELYITNSLMAWE